MAQPGQTPTAEVPVEVPKKPQWECAIKTEPKDAKGYTVGEVFQVDCSGTSLQMTEPLKAVNPEKIKYSFVYLKTLKKSENELSFLATTYAAQPVEHPFLHIEDAQGGGFISQKIQIRSQSVIDPQKPPQGPYGPITPIALSWPYWIFFPMAIFAAVMVGWFVIFLRRHFQRKNLEKNIRKFESPLGSYHQFSKDLRLLKRGVVFSEHNNWSESQTQSYIDKLDEIYRMYVLREYIVPAIKWSPAQIAKHLNKKFKKQFRLFKDPFWKAFKELERAKGHIQDIKPRDCEQLTQLCWLAVDAMWKSKREKTS